MDTVSLGHIKAILRDLHGNSGQLSEDYPKHLRVALEQMFRVAIKQGLISDKCLKDGEVNITACVRSICGMAVDNCGIGPTAPHAPTFIKDLIYVIRDTTNGFNHSKTTSATYDRIETQKLVDRMPKLVLLYRLTFQLLEVMLWFSAYNSDAANQDVEENKAKLNEVPNWEPNRGRR